MLPEELKQNVTVYGPLFPEPVQIIIAVPMGSSVKLVGKGVRSSTVYEPILSADQLGQLQASPIQEPFDGDSSRFRLGVEAMRLGLAYEYDPYFSLSIARVDPLPHQLEAVYDYFLKLPRIRFLLADDPGAGKTIMAGLLIKELKIRGLVKRTVWNCLSMAVLPRSSGSRPKPSRRGAYDESIAVGSFRQRPDSGG